MSRAVLVIDVQRALCEGEYRTLDAAGVIGRINEVTAKARAANALVVIIQHESKDGLLVHGSRGWELAPELQTAETDTFLEHLTAAQITQHHNETLSNIDSFGVKARLENARDVLFR
jgi:nicotinamidase-related amidase